MLSTLYVKESLGKKECCEDNIWVEESTQYIVGCICDGCSTGIKSSFASQLFCYLFQKEMFYPTLCNSLMEVIIAEMSDIADRLDIKEMNLLSTFIPFIYYKDSRKLRLRVFGDGFYRINEVDYVIEQDNTPDYIGHSINNSFAQNTIYLDKYPELIYENVDSFIISSDGINSLQQNQFVQLDCTQDPKEFLLAKPDSSNCLQRRYNILRRNKVNNSDDLGIILYVND